MSASCNLSSAPPPRCGNTSSRRLTISAGPRASGGPRRTPWSGSSSSQPFRWGARYTGSSKNIFRKYKYNFLQAPSILPETESNIDRSLGQFTKELGQMDTAVKKISDIAVDQANKYKNTMKKDYQVFKSVDVGLCTKPYVPNVIWLYEILMKLQHFGFLQTWSSLDYESLDWIIKFCSVLVQSPKWKFWLLPFAIALMMSTLLHLQKVSWKIFWTFHGILAFSDILHIVILNFWNFYLQSFIKFGLKCTFELVVCETLGADREQI